MILKLIDSYGRLHELTDNGSDWLSGILKMADGPMPYWIPRAIACTWRAA